MAKTVFILSLWLSLFAAGQSKHQASVSLTYLKSEEAGRALEQVFGEKLLVKESGKGEIQLSSDKLTTLIEALTLVSRIDLPNISPPTHWFQPDFADCELVVKQLETFRGKKAAEITLTPDPRTNRIFLMGDLSQKEKITKFVSEADAKAKATGPPFRGSRWAARKN